MLTVLYTCNDRYIDVRRWMLLCLVFCSFLSCLKKVPLSEDYGSFSFSSFHWFANERVAYMFFTIDEFPERLDDFNIEFAYTWQNASGGTESSNFKKIDFSSGVHKHELVQCGGQSICGSFSWPLNGPLESVQMRLRYDSQSPLTLTAEASSIQNHAATSTPDAYSMIPFLVFNADNNKVQFRAFHNFGYPSSDQVEMFGMVRRYKIHDAYLNDTPSIADLRKLLDQNSFAFPATFCSQRPTTQKIQAAIFEKSDLWLKDEFDAKKPDKGACLEIEFLDQNNKSLLKTFGYGFRNPVVASNGLKLQTPLQDAIKIPVTIESCDGPFAAELRNDEFLEYQKFILNMNNANIDVCFDINNQKKFRDELRVVLQNKLAETKIQNTSKRDYLYTVIFHENLSAEYYHFHTIIADELFRLIDGESSFNSPKLAGALVYGSTAEYQPTTLQKKYIMWCPQEQPIPIAEGGLPIGNPNCTISKGNDLKLLGINFVAPMGPFPNLENYLDYTKKYGDTGLAKKPSLVLRTVPSSANTMIEKRNQVTYFDNVRLTIAAQEAVKVCYEKAGAQSILPALRFRPSNLGLTVPGLTIFEVESIWNSELDTGDYKIGIKWDFPFWGGISYKSSLAVDVVSVIPFYNDISNYERLGDSIWRNSSWNVGDYFHHCRKYCEHPFFESNGIYRNSASWQRDGNNKCLNGTPPVWKLEDY